MTEQQTAREKLRIASEELEQLTRLVAALRKQLECTTKQKED